VTRAWWAVLLAATMAIPVAADDSSTEPPDGGRKLRLFGTLAVLFENNRTSIEASGDAYDKFKTLLGINLGWGKFSAGAQLEYLYWSDQELAIAGDLDRLREGFEPRKYWLDYTTENFKGRLGTFFTSFGRGLTLYVQKNEVVGIDEPIHGLDLTTEIGPFEFEALGGNVTDPLLENTFNREFEDTIWGGRAQVNLPYDTYLGASYADATLQAVFPGEDDDRVEVWSVEGGGYGLAGVLDLHGEWAEIEKVERGRGKDGYGGYFSAAANIGMVTILGEYKDYWNFAYRYNNPPTAGPTDEAYEHNDVVGPRLLVSGNILATGTLLTGSYGSFDTHRREDSIGGENGDEQEEWLVSLQETAGPIYLEASYFHRDWIEREIVEEHVKGDLHITVLEGMGDVAIGYDLRKESTNFFSRADHRSYLSFSRSPWGSFGLRYAWNDRTSQEKEEFWGWDFQYLPTRSLTLTLFVGSDPGGLVCAGGQCREEPPFKGIRATGNWRF